MRAATAAVPCAGGEDGCTPGVMVKVIPLRYGTIFKKAFRDSMVFSRFASDVLGMPIEITTVHQEFS